MRKNSSKIRNVKKKKAKIFGNQKIDSQSNINFLSVLYS